MKRLGQKICVAVVLSLAFVAIWHDSAKAAMPVIASLGQIKDSTVVSPNRIDVDAAGTIYLNDPGRNAVTRYDKYGQALSVLKGAYRVAHGGVAVTPDGSRVFVSVSAPGNTNATAVAVINGSTGELITYLGSGLNEFKRVVEIDRDGSGNIYVGNYDKPKTTANLVNTAQVVVYSGSTYAKLYSFGSPATNLVSGYYLPLDGQFGEIAGLTVDEVNKEVLVTEGWNNNGIARVQIFALNGTFKRNLPEATFAGTQVNCKPIGMSVDPTGRVYLLSSLTSTIHVFTAHPEAYQGGVTKGTPDPAFSPTGQVYPWTVGMIPTPSSDTIYDPATKRIFVVTDGNGIQIFSVDGSTNPVKIVNTAPGTPVLVAPAQGGEVVSLTPTLQWSPAVDAENDVLTYNVRITALNGSVVSSSNNISGTSLAVAAGSLQENNSYNWQVQAADASLTSAYSSSQSFWVNALEEAPSVARPLAPAPAATVNKNTVFSWQAASDLDPFDTVKYRLEIAKTTDFSAPIITLTQNGTETAALSTLAGYSLLQAGETYLWRVVAIDSTGLTTTSDYRSFDCNSAPEIPVLLSPVQGAKVSTLTPTLQWSAIDVDGDTLTYSVQILKADGTVASTQSVVAASDLTVAGSTLLENKGYGWRVQAADLELTSSYSGVETFWVNTVEEAPTAPLLTSPASEAVVDKDSYFSWEAATDVDPLATLSYRLEIAQAGEFAAPVIAVPLNNLSTAAFSTLAGYADLKPDTTYQWRVVAIDNTGLTAVSAVRSFRYVSTILTVDAHFPGAKVYLGGNSAYSGRYVGEVPVSVRDINPGTVEIVVECPGFEPWVKSVVVAPQKTTAVAANLVVAILPSDYKLTSILADGLKILGGAEAAPVFVDFNNDGHTDLLVADGSGKLLLYKGIDGADWPFSAGVQLSGLTLPVGAVPFVADWNNDDRKDLLAGATDGTVTLYENIGTQTAPLFASGVPLLADYAPLNVVSNAVPVLYDLDGDGAKDLLVGSGDGAVYKFMNIGSDAAPLLGGRQVLIAAASGSNDASPVVADWDADGVKEILVAASRQSVIAYEQQADGSFAKGAALPVHQSLYNNATGSYEMNTDSFGQKVRMAAVNVDGLHGKDLLFGNAAGEILLAASTQNAVTAISPLFDAALLATVAEIEAQIRARGKLTPVIVATISHLKSDISSQAPNKLVLYAKAKKSALTLQNTLKNEVEITALLAKLQLQLSSDIPLNN